MNTLLLVGNGLSSQLISEYKDENMIKVFEREVGGDIAKKANELFECFRFKLPQANLRQVNQLSMSITPSAGSVFAFSGFSLYPGDPYQPPILDRDSQLYHHIIDALKQAGFESQNPEKVFREYFDEYGLIFEPQNNRIMAIE